MPFAAVQDVIVGLIAAGAAALVVRRVVGFASPDSPPKCASCETGTCAATGSITPPAPSASPVGTPGPVARPLVFIRPSDR